MSHTKGPWKWEDGYIVDSQQVPYPVASVNAMGSIAESEANARLIAAAPEMLDALNLVLDYLHAFQEEEYSDERKLRVLIEGIINKATGAQEDGQ